MRFVAKIVGPADRHGTTLVVPKIESGTNYLRAVPDTGADNREAGRLRSAPAELFVEVAANKLQSILGK